ncbi:hypothetical protein [Psychrobacter okhotskensis]|uniref:hypothetical protein n=1 Tax=Psychrobacter okhotskensis TaxID=212403 RepID=UPI00191ABB67|nr:hypothetical protein [Psychrobacter okhotskensis]
MSILIGIGIVTTVTTFYLGRKGWQALHKAVGITPGVPTYQDYDVPLSLSTLSPSTLLSTIHWQQLTLNTEHLKVLSEPQLRQLKGIDEKVNSYHNYQKEQQAQHKTPEFTESQFVLHKLLHTRLPETLASYCYLTKADISTTNISTNNVSNGKKAEANELLQQVFNNIEIRLDRLLAQEDARHLQDLRVMTRYMDSHRS